MQRKRFLTIVFLAFCALALALFGVSCKEKEKTEEQQYLVTVYGSSGEELKTYSFSSANDNVIDLLPRKTGHYFTGWHTQDSTENLFGRDGAQSGAPLSAQQVKLYPAFSPITYEFLLETEEAYGQFNSGNSMTYLWKYTEDSELVLPIPEALQETWLFDGYYEKTGEQRYTNAEGKLTVDLFNQTGVDKNGKKRVTLCAKHTRRTVTVTFDYAGKFKNKEYVAYYGEEFSTLQTVINEHKKVDGSMEVTAFTLADGSENFPEILTEDLTLKAVWKRFREIKFIYTSTDSRTQKIYENEQGKFTLPIPERAGYRFIGWYDNADYLGGTYEIASLRDTYYAKWRMAEYLVSFVCDNGETFEEKTYYYGDEVILPTPTAVNGYDFGGWTETPPSEEETETTSVFKITADMYGDKTYYPLWIPEEYEIALNAGYGFLKTSTAKVRFEREYELPKPTRTGYTFTGWYSETEGGTRHTDPDGVSIRAWEETAGKTLYARYARANYTIVYNTQGGSAVSSQRYDHGRYFDFPETPVKAGYAFAGWYNEDFTREYTERETVREGVTLYAKWLETSSPIASADDLRAIAQNPAGNYHLTCDINLMGETWTPIAEFSGTLDGKGYKIFNFSMTSATPETFGFITNNVGTVKNLTLSKVAVHSATSVANGQGATALGAFAGYNRGVLRNCVLSECTIQATASVQPVVDRTSTNDLMIGGLAAKNTGVIEYCLVDGIQITASLSVPNNDDVNRHYQLYGGLYVGGIAEENAANAVIRGCTVTGTLTTHTELTGCIYEAKSASYHHLGGVATFNKGDCLNNTVQAKLQGTAAEGWWKHYYWHGETPYTDLFLGGMVTENTGTVSGCVFTGETLADASRYIRMGGIAGQNDNGGKIVDCYATGTLTQQGGGEKMLGGIVGNNYSKVNNCVFGGEVITANSYASYVGGFVGVNHSGVISNSFTYGNVTFTNGAGTAYGIFVGANLATISGCAFAEGAKLTISGSVQTLSSTQAVVLCEDEKIFTVEYVFNTLYFNPQTWILNENGISLCWQEWV